MRQIPLATRQLARSRALAIGGLVGVAASLVLIIVLDAFLQGIEYRLTGFIRATGADIVVAQDGVRTMHMTESAIPLDKAHDVGLVPGVRDMVPALYVPATVQAGSRSGLVYLVGYNPTGPRLLKLHHGSPPGRRQVVIDATLARNLNVDVGDDVVVFSQPVRVSGLIDGTFSIASSTALVDIRDLTMALATPDTASYVFTRVERGASPGRVARDIEQQVPGVTATTTSEFQQSERRVVSDMATGIIRAITMTALLIGLTISALVAHTLVSRQSRDVAVLRAIGLSKWQAMLLAMRQVALVLAGAILLSLIVVLTLDQLLPYLSDSLTLRLVPTRLVRAQLLVAAAVVLGTLLPAWRTLSVDPAKAFRT